MFRKNVIDEKIFLITIDIFLLNGAIKHGMGEHDDKFQYFYIYTLKMHW